MQQDEDEYASDHDADVIIPHGEAAQESKRFHVSGSMNTLENHEVDSSEEHTDEEIYSSEDEEEEHAAQEKEAYINDNEEVEGAVNQPQTRGGDVKAEIMRPASSGSGSRHNLEDIHDGERRGDSGNSNLMLENLYSHGITHWIGGDDATIDSATVDEVITEADMYKGTEEVDEASSTSHASRSQSRKSRNESRNGRTSASRAESGHHSRSQNNKSASISGTESMNGATTTEERRPESRDEGISTSRSERRSRVGSAENGTGSGNVSRSASRGSSGGGSKSTGGNRPKSSSEKGINGYSRDESRNNNRSESGSRKGGDDGHTSEGTMTSTPIGEDYRNSEDFIDFINNSETNNSNGRTGVGDTGEVGGDGEGSETDVVDMEEATSMRASSRHGIVTIEWDTIKKPFLGGFRHKQTGVEYHHAATQTYRPTPLRVLQKMLITKYHRDTQTTDTAHNKVQPLRECGTQMARTGLYISEEGAKVMIARPYFTADQLFDLKTRKAIKIQCMVRRWFARRKVRRLREHRARMEAQFASQQDEKQREVEAVRRREIERRRNPRTKQDFDILYQELEAWHQQETARILGSTEAGTETRKSSMYALLQKQTQLLQTIDRLKLQANKANQAPKIAKNLAQMAAPKQWGGGGGGGGGGVEVTTPFTQRAEELMGLYVALREPLLTIDQRLDILLHVKWTVKEFTTQLTKDIIELIDREADLLNRGRSEKSVEALRQRTCNLFLKFIETPEFNPEAASLKTNKSKKIIASST